MSASTKETTKVKITTTDTSPKKSPIDPSKNKKMANAMMVVKIAWPLEKKLESFS